jgi:hypothetical protein
VARGLQVAEKCVFLETVRCCRACAFCGVGGKWVGKGRDAKFVDNLGNAEHLGAEHVSIDFATFMRDHHIPSFGSVVERLWALMELAMNI